MNKMATSIYLIQRFIRKENEVFYNGESLK